jgi:hypothetical protein
MGGLGGTTCSISYQSALGCEAARLRGCEAARLRGCEAARLRGCEAARLRGYREVERAETLRR